jgi:hypothetical protein
MRLRWGVALAVVLAFLPVPAVSVLEEHDGFCIACHTAPEVAYYNRAQAALAGQAPAVDLASAHYSTERFRCIDCHRGNGSLPHRAVTLTLGARDTLTFLTGRADPAIEKAQAAEPGLLTAGCVNCHAVGLLVAGFENHFHNKLPAAFAAWQAGGDIVAPASQPGADTTQLEHVETGVACHDCHRAHVQLPGAELTGYLDLENVVLPACVQCHRDAARGPLELIAP